MRRYIIATFILSFTLKAAAQSLPAMDKHTWSVAIESGSIDLISAHPRAGIDVNTVDPNNGNTALINAVESGNLVAVKLLVSAGADLNTVIYTDRREKKCALTSAFPFPEILHFLLDSGADPNIKLNQQQTPLHYAAGSSNIGANSGDKCDTLSLLLEYGADPNATDLYGRTPLHFGIYNIKMAIALLDGGADLQITDHEGWKAFYRAYGRDTELLRELAKRRSFFAGIYSKRSKCTALQRILL